jgi:hypothetical protein
MFDDWTSGHQAVDDLIRDTQLRAIVCDFYLEWVDPEELSDVKHLADGGFGSVYTATWTKGIRRYVYSHDTKLYEQGRTGSCMVALKTLHNSEDLSNEFIHEVNVLTKAVGHSMLLRILTDHEVLPIRLNRALNSNTRFMVLHTFKV